MFVSWWLMVAICGGGGAVVVEDGGLAGDAGAVSRGDGGNGAPGKVRWAAPAPGGGGRSAEKAARESAEKDNNVETKAAPDQ